MENIYKPNTKRFYTESGGGEVFRQVGTYQGIYKLRTYKSSTIPRTNLVVGSVNGRISYFHGERIKDLGKLAHVEDGDVITVDGSMAGEVKAGYIQVKGPLMTSQAVREAERQQCGSEIADYINSFVVVAEDCNPERFPGGNLWYLGLLESYMESMFGCGVYGLLSRRWKLHEVWSL